MQRLDHYWYSQNPVAWLLLPLSWLFRLLSVIRKKMYQMNILSSTRLSKPVIVVGNIAVGGTGKTPLLIALSQLLVASGYRPGIISRGYGSELMSEMLVTADTTAAELGDEPILIASRTSRPVAVGRDRVAAANLLLAHHDCDLILSDDGLQHYALQRDIEIAVVDAKRMHGNGYYLPAGPLRESVDRLQSVDLVVYNGSATDIHSFKLEQLSAVNITTGARSALSGFVNKHVHAVAGIGDPQRFFDQLRQAGLNISPHPFADHHVYTQAELMFSDNNDILMTEKDAVKCRHLGLTNIWSVPVAARLTQQLSDDFMDYVHQIVEVRRRQSR